MTKINLKRIKATDQELKDRLVHVNRVTKVTKGGRTFSFSARVRKSTRQNLVTAGRTWAR